jgi:HD-GYP domain-containing protein (c-di-GMP phosphodiesterase class II)
MATIKRFLTVGDLRPGMTVVSDIRFDNKLLIGNGIAITESVLRKLKEYYFFNMVEVYCEENELPNKVKENTYKSTMEVNKTFSELSFSVEDIFNNLQKSGIDEVRNFTKIIQEELKYTSAIIKNIILYGSGTDTIFRHSVNVAALSSILGMWIGLNDNEINLLTYSAILHDFGKTKIDKAILEKKGTLTTKEFKLIKEHPIIGYNIVKDIPYLDNSVFYGILMHHERMDGSGYPLGIKEDKIHTFAKIIAIVDVFDAINSDRAYKNSEGPFEALEIIQKESLGKLHYEYCKVFLSHVVNYYMGENVLLNTNKVCKIIQVDPNNLTRPLLLDDSGFIDLKYRSDLKIIKLI